MERFLLYWDDLDDLIGAIGLHAEQLRRVLMFIATMLLLITALSASILLALVEPPLAMAAATLLLVTLMYRSVTTLRLGKTSA